MTRARPLQPPGLTERCPFIGFQVKAQVLSFFFLTASFHLPYPKVIGDGWRRKLSRIQRWLNLDMQGGGYIIWISSYICADLPAPWFQHQHIGTLEQSGNTVKRQNESAGLLK